MLVNPAKLAGPAKYQKLQGSAENGRNAGMGEKNKGKKSVAGWRYRFITVTGTCRCALHRHAMDHKDSIMPDNKNKSLIS